MSMAPPGGRATWGRRPFALARDDARARGRIPAAGGDAAAGPIGQDRGHVRRPGGSAVTAGLTAVVHGPGLQDYNPSDDAGRPLRRELGIELMDAYGLRDGPGA